MRNRNILALECLLLFGGLPIIILLFKQRAVMVAILWLTALGTCLILRRTEGFSLSQEWNRAGFRAGLKEVLIRFAGLAPLLLLFTWLHDPQRLFSFPLERPQVWLMVMVLYPLLSVMPQELIFRTFLFHRYTPLFSNTSGYMLFSALSFGYVHIIFMNWISVLFCTVGGWMFAQTYIRHRSLALVCFEHAIYGCYIFTIGLGWYFYGSAWHR